MPMLCDDVLRMIANGAVSIIDGRVPADGGTPGRDIPLSGDRYQGMQRWVEDDQYVFDANAGVRWQ
jgi:hypothetical protein